MPCQVSASSFIPLFTLPPDSDEIIFFLSSLNGSPASPIGKPEVKSYPDAIYHNYYCLGLSLCFIPDRGLDSIDIFNPSPLAGSSTNFRSKKDEPSYSPPPTLDFHFPTTTITLPPRKEGEVAQAIPRPERVILEKDVRGRDFVACLGEPSRKGSGGWTGLWLEWKDVELVSSAKEGGTVKVGIMIELRDPGALEQPDEEGRKKGMGGIWERAARWEWKSVKLFKAGE